MMPGSKSCSFLVSAWPLITYVLAGAPFASHDANDLNATVLKSVIRSKKKGEEVVQSLSAFADMIKSDSPPLVLHTMTGECVGSTREMIDNFDSSNKDPSTSKGMHFATRGRLWDVGTGESTEETNTNTAKEKRQNNTEEQMEEEVRMRRMGGMQEMKRIGEMERMEQMKRKEMERMKRIEKLERMERMEEMEGMEEMEEMEEMKEMKEMKEGNSKKERKQRQEKEIGESGVKKGGEERAEQDERERQREKMQRKEESKTEAHLKQNAISTLAAHRA